MTSTHGGKRAGSGRKPGAKKKNLKPDSERKSEKIRIDIRLTPERKKMFVARLNAAIESAGMSKSEFALAALMEKIETIKGDKMSVKLNKARKLAKIGKHPRTWADVTARIDADVIKKCSSKELAKIADEMYNQHLKGENAMYAELKS